MQRLVLIDGSNVVFRAYFAVPAHLSTVDGLPTNATYGVAMMFEKLKRTRRFERGAVVFDAPDRTFRDEVYADYKSDRAGVEEGLAVQFPHVERIVRAQGFQILQLSGVEADDVIGTLARQGEAEGLEVLIVSSDKDFCQLVGPRVRMFDPWREVTYDADLVQKRWGVPPEHFVDLLALMGDKIDNIPGVPGIGQKTAQRLIEAHGSLDQILACTGDMKGMIKNRLEAHQDDARMSRELAQIRTTVDLPIAIGSLELAPIEPAVLSALYRELEFYSLLPDDAGATGAGDVVDEPAEIVRDKASLEKWAARVKNGPAAVLSYHAEATIIRTPWIGIAVADADGHCGYVPWTEEARRHLGPWLEDPSGAKWTHDAKRLWHGATEAGLTLSGVTVDTQLASYLVEPSKLIPHRLDQIAKEYLQRVLPTEKKLIASIAGSSGLGGVPVEQIASVATVRVRALRAIWPLLEKKLEAEEQLVLYRTLELPLAFILGALERGGVRADKDDLIRVGEDLKGRLTELERDIFERAGRSFNLGSPKQLAAVLFEELGLPVLKRTKTGFSTASDVLQRLCGEHEIARVVLEHRKLAKLVTTYTNVLSEAVRPETGRIHATYQQTAGVTGRLVCTDPDLQRTPIRTPEGKRIRSAFVAGPGERIVSADWSQIDLRVLAHFSKDPALMRAFREGRDVHRETAAVLFSVPGTEVTEDQRRVGKTVNYATVYGQGATALAKILGVARREAERYIARYFEAHQAVRNWIDQTIERAHSTGYVTTIAGRRRVIPELYSRTPSERQAGERIATNTPIQGSSADIAKRAMLDLHRELASRGLRAQLVMQIHDELVLETPAEEVDVVAALVRRSMEEAEALDVPLVVDVGVGQTWAEAH